METRTFSEGQRAALHMLMSRTELHSGVLPFDGLIECPKPKENLPELSFMCEYLNVYILENLT